MANLSLNVFGRLIYRIDLTQNLKIQSEFTIFRHWWVSNERIVLPLLNTQMQIYNLCMCAEDVCYTAIMRHCRGERIVFWGPNTNTNIIRVPKNDRIRIRILFGFPKLTEYEYEYYSGFQKWPNTNTNIIRLPKNDRIRIRILFGFPKMTEYKYEYYSTL